VPVRLENIGRGVRETQYAVRGPIVARAQELEQQGRTIIYCNIGNPQSLGQRPLTWIRQALALAECPELAAAAPQAFPADVLEVAEEIRRGSAHGLGAYTESKGFRFVRQAVAAFISVRDGIPADPEAVFLTDGASKAAQAVLSLLLSGPRDGILIPTPQYPLYSATITLYGGAQIPYLLDEARDWKLTRAELDRAAAEARRAGITPRAIVVINPGNPTGAVLGAAEVEMVLDFARANDLAVLADEVYQENVYRPGDRFVSFASLLERRGLRDVSLFSFHSTSKGLLGECGHRGGYVECRNVPAEVMQEFVKLQSISLCANAAGQVVTYLLVRPPRPGGPSHARWVAEKQEILGTLARRARLLEEGLNAVPGIHCNAVAGAMYAFPRITLPPGVTDGDWCMALLEQTGICVVPGSGFGQAPGTWHFRTTILPPLDQIEQVVERLGRFHREFTARRAAAPA
jgi:aspartate/methionine/tyrosine aminotransferase